MNRQCSRETKSSAPVAVCAAIVCIAMAACMPPRDDGTSLPCSTNAQCPATGTTYCDKEKGVCTACNGPCPGANAPSSDAGTTSSSDTGSSTDTGATTESDTATAAGTDTAATDTSTDTVASEDGADEQPAGSCADKCGDPYDSTADCQCSVDCSKFGDCCADYEALCKK